MQTAENDISLELTGGKRLVGESIDAGADDDDTTISSSNGNGRDWETKPTKNYSGFSLLKSGYKGFLEQYIGEAR